MSGWPERYAVSAPDGTPEPDTTDLNAPEQPMEKGKAEDDAGAARS